MKLDQAKSYILRQLDAIPKSTDRGSVSIALTTESGVETDFAHACRLVSESQLTGDELKFWETVFTASLSHYPSNENCAENADAAVRNRRIRIEKDVI